MRTASTRWLIPVVPVLLVVAAVGCGSSSDDTSPPTTMAAPTSSVDSTDPGSTAPDDAASTTAAAGTEAFCDTARRIVAEVGGDALEVDDLRDHPGRFDDFRSGVARLDVLLQQLAGRSPEPLRDDLHTLTGAVHEFAADAKSASSADELIEVAPDFDSGALGRAGERIEDFVEADCRVDLDLD